jgi:endonuclease YncB( thermonuclease family)
MSLAFLCFAAVATAETGRAIRVADGDTITVQTDDNRRVTIRLQGIDAPERTMPYSQVSRRHLHELVMGKVVTFNPEKLDRHGRTVAVVRFQDGTDVCLAQIEAGLAWHFKRYELEQSREERAAYGAAEVIARAARRGLWRDENPVSPWEFRARSQRYEAPVSSDEKHRRVVDTGRAGLVRLLAI